MNIHISDNENKTILPIDKKELDDDEFSVTLCEMSSLFPIRYNDAIANMRKDTDRSIRHYALGVNADTATLLQLMDIGTPTNIALNK